MLYDQVKELILERQTLSNNSCGTSIMHITKCLEVNTKTIKSILNQLYKEKYIIVRKGINGELIFLKNYKQQQL